MQLTLLTALAGLSTALATPLTAVSRQTNNSSLSAGCGKTTTLKSGKQPSIQVNGQARDWILRIPAGYDASKPHKLIFGLHWLNGDYNAVDSGNFYSLEPLANNTAIFVAPNGLNHGWANTNGQDITFIGDLMQQVEDSLCVDLNQVYSVGWSYGGAMSHSVACSFGSKIRAIAVLSGALLSGCAGGTAPVAYYGEHGVGDSVLPFTSGEALRDHWVSTNKCTPQTPKTTTSGSGTHVITDYSGCSAGHPVEWVAFDGPHEPLATDRGQSQPWTPNAVWKFWSQFF